jgi:hypothetical protein
MRRAASRAAWPVRVTWKLIGAAGLAGVAATGVVVARRRRAQRDYDAESCALASTADSVRPTVPTRRPLLSIRKVRPMHDQLKLELEHTRAGPGPPCGGLRKSYFSRSCRTANPMA